MRQLRSRLAALGFLGAAVSVPVFAQQPGGDYPAACDEAKVTRGDHDRAHTVFLSGKQFLEESNYDKAISYFKDAYAIDCSVHAMLPIIATAYERKGDKAEAIRALGEYLRRAPTAPDHEIVEHRIRNLRDQLAREQPPTPAASSPPSPPQPSASAPPPLVAPAPTSVAPPAGSSSAPASSAGGLPEPAPEGSQSPAPWILLGVGGAAAAVGVVMVVVGAGDISSANSDCPGHQCPPGLITSATQKQSDGYTLENAGGVVIGVGAAAAVTGLIWGIVQSAVHGAGTPSTSAAVSPVVAPGYGGLSVGGHF